MIKLPIVARTERTLLVNLIDLLEGEYPTNYRSWFTDPVVTKHNAHGLFPYTEAAMTSYINEIEKEHSIVWAILVPPPSFKISGNWITIDPQPDTILEENPFHIGNITLQRINWIYQSAEMAIVLGESVYWGKGIATEVLEALFNHGFNRINLHRIWSGTASSNVGMQRVFDKLGMVREGTFRHAMFINGVWTDVFVYGILQSEWQKG